MKCFKCGEVNKEDAAVCSGCGAALQDVVKKSVPSSMTIQRPSSKKVEIDDTDDKKQIPKGLLAVMLCMGALLVAGVIFVGIMLLTQPGATAAVGPAPTSTQTATPEPTAEPSPSPTPVSTTTVPPDEDLSSLFETPTADILPE